MTPRHPWHRQALYTTLTLVVLKVISGAYRMAYGPICTNGVPASQIAFELAWHAVVRLMGWA